MTIEPDEIHIPGMSIAVPADWIIVDPERATDADAVAEVIDKRIGDGSLTEEFRDSSIELVGRIARQAIEMDVRFTAVLVTADRGGPVVAFVTLGSALFEMTSDARTNGTTSEADAAPSGEGSQATGSSARAPVVTRLRLPSGPAVRVERSTPFAVGAQYSQDIYSVQYLVPIDEQGTAALITGASPAIRRKDDLDRVFQEIAETLEIDRPGT